MSDAVLNKSQVNILYSIRDADAKRLRHEEEPWESQAVRDAMTRDDYIYDALNMGISRAQIDAMLATT